MLAIKLTILACCLSVLAAALYKSKVDIACPGVNSELQCPKGSRIGVRYINHGSQSTKICAARNKHVQTTRRNCVKVGYRNWVKMICDNTERCRLPKPNAKMYKRKCVDPKKEFIQISYVCKKKYGKWYKAVACEGQEAQMKCEKGCIRVVKAYFGRHDETTCTNSPSKMTFCRSYRAGGYVRKMCNKQKECKIKANTETLGCPRYCDSLPKYLNVDYVCVKCSCN